MVVHVEVQPALLRWAVERARWDDETLSRRVPDFASWVSGSARPTLRQLERFAHATHAPFGQLFLDEPPQERIPIPDMRTMATARSGPPSADLLETIYTCQLRQDWYREFSESSDEDRIGWVASVDASSSPTLVAGRIRGALEYGTGTRSRFPTWAEALRWLIERVEDSGVLVMINGIVGSDTHRRLDPSEFRGFALADHRAPLIFVNGADTKSAQIFTLIHELAHLWLGGSALSEPDPLARDVPREERWCDDVAAEVLVPLEEFEARRDLGTDVESLDRLAREYKVSTLVILRRMFEAGFVVRDEFFQIFEEERGRVLALMASRKESNGGEYYRTQTRRLGRKFVRAVVTSAAEGSTSYREAFHLLGTKKRSTFDGLAESVGLL